MFSMSIKKRLGRPGEGWPKAPLPVRFKGLARHFGDPDLRTAGASVIKDGMLCVTIDPRSVPKKKSTDTASGIDGRRCPGQTAVVGTRCPMSPGNSGLLRREDSSNSRASLGSGIAQGLTVDPEIGARIGLADPA